MGSIRAAAKLIRNEPAERCCSGSERKVNMGATRSNKLPPSDWVTRCVQQIQLSDPGIDGQEAVNVAQQLLSFERTAAMPPEMAVKFVVSELAGRTPRFERRSPSRLLTSFRL
jgi:hypothetical protein